MRKMWIEKGVDVYIHARPILQEHQSVQQSSMPVLINSLGGDKMVPVLHSLYTTGEFQPPEASLG